MPAAIASLSFSLPSFPSHSYWNTRFTELLFKRIAFAGPFSKGCEQRLICRHKGSVCSRTFNPGFANPLGVIALRREKEGLRAGGHSWPDVERHVQSLAGRRLQILIIGIDQCRPNFIVVRAVRPLNVRYWDRLWFHSPRGSRNTDIIDSPMVGQKGK